MPHYCIRCGAQLVPRLIEGREHEACPNDDFVLWHDPKVSSAVVIETDGGIILGRRAIEPGYGLWCLPGGFVNDDEHPAEAARRECQEEIGAEVEVTGLIGVYHVAKQDAPSMIGLAFRARLADGERYSPGAEMLEVAVFPLDQLPPLAFPSHRQVVADLVRSLGSAEGSAGPPASPAAPSAGRPSPAPAPRP